MERFLFYNCWQFLTIFDNDTFGNFRNFYKCYNFLTILIFFFLSRFEFWQRQSWGWFSLSISKREWLANIAALAFLACQKNERPANYSDQSKGKYPTNKYIVGSSLCLCQCQPIKRKISNNAMVHFQRWREDQQSRM